MDAVILANEFAKRLGLSCLADIKQKPVILILDYGLPHTPSTYSTELVHHRIVPPELVARKTFKGVAMLELFFADRRVVAEVFLKEDRNFHFQVRESGRLPNVNWKPPYKQARPNINNVDLGWFSVLR